MPRFSEYVDAVYNYLENHMPFEVGSVVALKAAKILKESKLPQNPASLFQINYILNLLAMALDADIVEYSRGRLYVFRRSDLAELVKLGRDGFWLLVNYLDKARLLIPQG
mgnify:CR=1 FL=1